MRSPSTANTGNPLGPDSLTWKYFGDLRTGMLGVWIGAIQNMYPELGAGVEDHSILLREPLQRVARSVYPIMGVVYDGDRAPLTGEQIKRYHKTIKSDAIRPGPPRTSTKRAPLVAAFVEQYNKVRLHSAIGYITPADFLAGRGPAIWAERDQRLPPHANYAPDAVPSSTGGSMTLAFPVRLCNRQSTPSRSRPTSPASA